MAGFVVTLPHSQPPCAPASAPLDFRVLGVEARTGIAPLRTGSGRLALLDGHALGLPDAELVNALDAGDRERIAQLHGHYCALIFARDGVARGFCDRFGGRPLFWLRRADGRVVIASRWDLLPTNDRGWDDEGVAEMLRFRWTSEQRTVRRDVAKLSHRHRVRFGWAGTVSLRAVREAPAAPAAAATERSLPRAKERTRHALERVLEDVANVHGNAAIFLSGGVDSSLLAALARPQFRKCLLVTPVFPAHTHNPELPAARAYAQTLGLKHLLVKVDYRRLAPDLCWLVRAKGDQVKFHLLIMHQMLRAIPDEYPVVLYGNGADTCFGTEAFLRIRTLLYRKRYLDALPPAAVRALAMLPSRRLRRLAALRDASACALALRCLRIPYSAAEQAVVDRLSACPLDGIYAHRIVRARLGVHPLRAVLQDVVEAVDIANDAREIELSAARYGKQVAMPYLAPPVTEVAASLSDELFYGGPCVKPVLRELACEHFDRRLVHAPKLGFEVPYGSWLEGPLSGLVAAARRERGLFDGRLLDPLDPARCYPLFWSLINWRILAEQLTAGTRTETRAAVSGMGD